MERWVPLFQIFLHSPCPEGEASLWFQQQPPPSHNLTSAFLSLLEDSTGVLSRTTPSSSRRCMWIQTLPPVVQSRILSFLAMESHRFCRRRLHYLSSHILDDESSGARCDQKYFWVLVAARNLLDSVSTCGDPKTEEETTAEEGVREMEEDFYGVPAWLRSVTAEEGPLLPWLPLSPRHICDLSRRPYFAEKDEQKDFVSEEEMEKSPGDEAESQRSDIQTVDPTTLERALSLRTKISSATASSSDVLMMASEIQALCLRQKQAANRKSLKILSSIEPWRAEDEVASVLLTQLSRSCALDNSRISGLVLASIVLPKLMILESPASRALLSSTVDFCKMHQAAATNALFLPLVLLQGGINSHHCDLLTKIVRECLHPSHVSACCQKLLGCSSPKGEIICLPSQQSMIGDEPVWTESLFSLFHQILTRGVQLTPDAVDSIVSVVENSASEHGKSLKFCSFLLCMITRCPRAVENHKISLMRTAERTATFVTKSILSKLASQ